MTPSLAQPFAASTLDLPNLTVRTFQSFVEFANIPSPLGLFAPRQGQAFREEQRRRRSQFDRGTPGAEYEAYNNRLIDPVLSPIRPPHTPRRNIHGNNLGNFAGAAQPPYTPDPTVYSNNVGSFTGPVYGPPPAFPPYGYY
jgi:hypothetical protein